MEAYELKYTAEEIDGILESVDEKTIYGDATQSEHGLMSTTDKSKLDSLPSSQQINTSLSGKVDKVDGKGLSENDYDDTAKAKVDAIPADPKYTDTVYDDTALAGRVSTIEGKESGWDAKQDSLVSGTNIKTVNGESLLGSGNIEIQGGGGGGSGEENVIEAITMNGASVPVTNKTAAITETDPTVPSWAKQQNKPSYNYSEIGNTPDLSGFITTGALNTALANYATTQDLEDLKVFWVEPEVTTFAEIQDAINAGETVMLKDENDYVYVLSSIYNSSAITFTSASGEEESLKSYVIYDDDSWEYLFTEHIESKINKVTSISSSNVHEQYPSARAVYQALQSYTPTSQLATVATSGDYDDLTNKPTIPTVPTNVSSFTNDAGYITSFTEQDPVFTASAAHGITSSDIANWNSKGTYSKPSTGIPASDLESGVIPTVPVQDVTVGGTSVLSNGVAAVPSIPDISGKADKTLVASSMPIGGFLPNVVYNLGTLSGNTSFSMAAATDNTIANIWCWTFTTPSTAPTITWPAGITGWSGGSTPTINASKSYEITVMNGLATIIES